MNDRLLLVTALESSFINAGIVHTELPISILSHKLYFFLLLMSGFLFLVWGLSW